MHGFGDVGFGRATQVEKIQRRETRLPGRRAALPVGRRADAAPAVIGRIGGDDVELRRGPQGEGGERFVQFHPRVLHIPFNLVARWIFREHARRHGQRAAAAGTCERKRQRRRREGRDGRSGIALRTESTLLVLQRGRIDGDDHMRRVDAEIRQHVLIENGPQKPVPPVQSRKQALRRGATRGPVETGRGRAGGGAQGRVLQNDARRPARETDVVDADVDQERVGRALEDIVRPAARDGPAQRGGRDVVEAGRLLLPSGRRIGLSAPGRPRGAIGAEGLGPTNLLIRQSDLRAAADDALVGLSAPFDAVVA